MSRIPRLPIPPAILRAAQARREAEPGIPAAGWSAGETYATFAEFGRILVARGLYQHPPDRKTLWRWKSDGRLILRAINGREKVAVNATLARFLQQ